MTRRYYRGFSLVNRFNNPTIVFKRILKLPATKLKTDPLSVTLTFFKSSSVIDEMLDRDMKAAARLS